MSGYLEMIRKRLKEEETRRLMVARMEHELRLSMRQQVRVNQQREIAAKSRPPGHA